ncbi:MAG: capsule assembly Wzi family protein [Chloroflexi bacterium]|nr:MAG: capsule assembly Wzi family protein [Chloroflexota bacterium]
MALGNWMLFAGRVEQWWGPGWDTALLLSNNARPMPMVGLARLESKPFKTKWLRWIGPWNVRLFGARMSKLRADFVHPWLVGYRIDFAPAPWLSLGLTRLVQFCGKGRPCGAKTLFKVLNPAPNQLNVGSRKPDRGNAQAGYEIAFHGTFGSMGWSVYTEQAFEDQAEDNIATYGISLTGRMEAFGGGQWRVVGEASDTLDDRLAFNLGHTDRPFSSIYRNGVYTDGSIYRHRTLGSSLDFDSLLVTGRLMMQFDAGPSVELILRHAGINPRANNVLRPHLVSRTAEKINMLETRIIWPTERFGTFRLEGGIADDAPNTPGRSPTRGRIEMGWSYGF